MSRLLCIVALLSVCMSTSVIAQQSVDETLAVSAGGRVSIDNMRGTLNLIASADDEIRVVGTLDEKAENLTFEQRGNGVYIKVNTPKENGFRLASDDTLGSNLSIHMPASMIVSVKGVSMDVSAEDFTGGVEVRLVSGNVSVSRMKNKLLLKTVSGDIRADDTEGSVHFETVSGDITDKMNSGRSATYQSVSGRVISHSDTISELVAQSVSGDMTLTVGTLKKAKLTTVSGDITLNAALDKNANLKADGVSGDLVLNWRDTLDARWVIKSNAGGNIVNRLTDDKAEEAEWGRSSELSFDMGDGSAGVAVTTVSGNVTLDTK